MKKIFLLSLAAALAFSLNVGAQAFNSLSAGLGAGTDGLSLEVATPLSDHIQLRVGYGTAFGLTLYTLNDQVYMPTLTGNVYVPLQLGLSRNDGRILFNFYPGEGSFYFTAGLYLGSGSFVKGTMIDLPKEYDNQSIETTANADIKVVDRKIAMEYLGRGLSSPTFAVKPYVGVGFGRPVLEDRRVSFAVDLGVMYQGTPTVWYKGLDKYGNAVNVEYTQVPFFKDDTQHSIDTIGKYTMFWPTLNFHVYFKLF